MYDLSKQVYLHQNNKKSNIMNKIIVVTTEEQLNKWIELSKVNVDCEDSKQENEKPKRYVYGIRGIRELFNVSHPTALKYKNTFLKPAVVQRGRKIIVDAEKAMELFNER